MGQIQDTYLYKLNKSLNTFSSFTIGGNTTNYSLADLNSAYLWLSTLEITPRDFTVLSNPLKKSPLYCFSNSTGVVQVPQLWIVYVGSVLWRHSFSGTTADPIEWGDESILSGTDFDSSIYNNTQKTNLGIHYDMLNNSSIFNKISDYKTKGLVAPPTTNQIMSLGLDNGNVLGTFNGLKCLDSKKVDYRNIDTQTQDC